MMTLPLFLFFILLPCSKSQEDFLDLSLKWDYREGVNCLQHFQHERPSFLQETQGLVIYFARLRIVLRVTLLYHFLCSLRPVSAAVENLVREVQAIRKRIEELNERLNVINKAVLPIRINALQSQRRGNTHLRRLSVHKRRLPANRRLQRN
ncbi:UNVERIFIED_CONTAM: hypothetical protein H355_006901 [Colinus virginianus]|nr:hypothetical protein H355_006901 [Colinus virginianus]